MFKGPRANYAFPPLFREISWNLCEAVHNKKTKKTKRTDRIPCGLMNMCGVK